MAALCPLPPVRSISLPSRLPSTSPSIEDEENKLKISEVSIRADSDDQPVEIGLLRLTKSFNSMSSLIDHSLTRLQHCEMVEKALDESVALLEVCCLGKDLICSMRGKVQVLQSALRRKGGESSVKSHLVAYFFFRRSSSKDISRSIRAFTKIQKHEEIASSSSSSFIIQEANTITVNDLQLFVLLSSSPLMKTTFGGYSRTKSNEVSMNEAGVVDLALYSIHQQAKKGKNFKHQVPMVQKKLESLGVFMDGVEDGLHSTYKFLIQYRVSLLNSLTR